MVIGEARSDSQSPPASRPRRRFARILRFAGLVLWVQLFGCDALQPPYREPANLIRGSNQANWNHYVDGLPAIADHGIRIEERSGVMAGQRAYHIIFPRFTRPEHAFLNRTTAEWIRQKLSTERPGSKVEAPGDYLRLCKPGGEEAAAIAAQRRLGATCLCDCEFKAWLDIRVAGIGPEWLSLSSRHAWFGSGRADETQYHFVYDLVSQRPVQLADLFVNWKAPLDRFYMDYYDIWCGPWPGSGKCEDWNRDTPPADFEITERLYGFALSEHFLLLDYNLIFSRADGEYRLVYPREELADWLDPKFRGTRKP